MVVKALDGFGSGRFDGWDATSITTSGGADNGNVCGPSTDSGSTGSVYSQHTQGGLVHGKLTHSTKTWTAGQWVGHPFTVGGQTYIVLKNTATEVYVNSDWNGGTPPANGTAYTLDAAPAPGTGPFAFHQAENNSEFAGGDIQLLKQTLLGDPASECLSFRFRWTGRETLVDGLKFSFASLFDTEGKEVRELDVIAQGGKYYLHLTDDCDRSFFTNLTGLTEIVKDTNYTIEWRHRRVSSTIRFDEVYINAAAIPELTGYENAPGETNWAVETFGLDSGAVASATATTMTVTGAAWLTGPPATGFNTNYSVQINNPGDARYQIVRILSNTATVLTVAAWTNGTPTGADTFILIHTTEQADQAAIGMGGQQALAPRFDVYWGDFWLNSVDLNPGAAANSGRPGWKKIERVIPNGDSTTPWTVTGAATRWEATDETPTDTVPHDSSTTYMASSGTTAQALDLVDVSPSDNNVYAVRAYGYFLKEAGPGTTLRVGMRDGASDTESAGLTMTASYALAQFVLNVRPGAQGNWSVSTLNADQVYARKSAGTGTLRSTLLQIEYAHGDAPPNFYEALVLPKVVGQAVKRASRW